MLKNPYALYPDFVVRAAVVKTQKKSVPVKRKKKNWKAKRTKKM
jgi:hypothetical protein